MCTNLLRTSYCHHQHHFISPVRPCPFVFPLLLVGFLHSKFHSEHHHTPQPCDRLWLKQQKSVCTALPIRNVFEGSQICRKKAAVKVIFPFWISFKPIFDLNVIKAIFQDTIWLPTKNIYIIWSFNNGVQVYCEKGWKSWCKFKHTQYGEGLQTKACSYSSCQWSEFGFLTI